MGVDMDTGDTDIGETGGMDMGDKGEDTRQGQAQGQHTRVWTWGTRTEGGMDMGDKGKDTGVDTDTRTTQGTWQRMGGKGLGPGTRTRGT